MFLLHPQLSAFLCSLTSERDFLSAWCQQAWVEKGSFLSPEPRDFSWSPSRKEFFPFALWSCVSLHLCYGSDGICCLVSVARAFWFVREKNQVWLFAFSAGGSRIPPADPHHWGCPAPSFSWSPSEPLHRILSEYELPLCLWLAGFWALVLLTLGLQYLSECNLSSSESCCRQVSAVSVCLFLEMLVSFDFRLGGCLATTALWWVQEFLSRPAFPAVIAFCLAFSITVEAGGRAIPWDTHLLRASEPDRAQEVSCCRPWVPRSCGRYFQRSHAVFYIQSEALSCEKCVAAEPWHCSSCCFPHFLQGLQGPSCFPPLQPL